MNVSQADVDQLAGLVTFHAVTHYCQRVLDVVGLPETGRTQDVAADHCLAAGLTIGQVRALIMTPAVALACVLGMREARTREFIAKIAENGTVLTIIEARMRTRKKAKTRSRGEGRREVHKRQRRRFA